MLSLFLPLTIPTYVVPRNQNKSKKTLLKADGLLVQQNRHVFDLSSTSGTKGFRVDETGGNISKKEIRAPLSS